MGKYNSDLKLSKTHSLTIMDDITKLLSNEKIPYVYSANCEEIVVEKITKKDLEKLIRSKIELPAMILDILISVVEVKGKVFIRLKKK